MLTNLKSRLILWLARQLLPIIEVRDLLTFTKQGELLIGGEQATLPQVKNLQEEIKMLESMHVWRIINNYPQDIANKRIVTESKEWIDVLVGKMILYTLDVQSQVLQKIKELDDSGKPSIVSYREKAVKEMTSYKERLKQLAEQR